MKLSVAPLLILSFPFLIFASCGEPIHTADVPKPAPKPSLAKKIPQPFNAEQTGDEEKDEKTDELPRNVFAEDEKTQSSDDTFMEVQTGFEEFDLGDDPLSDRYNFSNFPKLGE